MQIARGLAAAHDKGLVHRDLKPENIFLLADGQVKILDFGLARSRRPERPTGATETVAAVTDPGIVMGTVGYMAPEQVRGQRVDARADLFAFGAVLYEMLAGRRAFRRDTPADTMTAILSEDPPELRRGAPTSRRRSIASSGTASRRIRSERFQTARDVAFALEALSGSGDAPRPTAAAGRGGGAPRAPVVGAAILVSLLSLAAWWVAQRPAAAHAAAPRQWPSAGWRRSRRMMGSKSVRRCLPTASCSPTPPDPPHTCASTSGLLPAAGPLRCRKPPRRSSIRPAGRRTEARFCI